MRRGGYDTVAFCPQRGDQIAGASRFVDIDPLVGSPDDVDVRRELAQRFDRVDIRMPKMTGLELIEYVQGKLHRNIQFVILTGYADFEYARKALKLQVVDYL